MSMHVVASTPNALILETYPEKKKDFNPALPQYEIKDGYAEVPIEPGLGLEPDAELVRKYRM